MNSNKLKLFLFFFIGAIFGILTVYLYNNYRIEKKNNTESKTEIVSKENNKDQNNNQKTSNHSENIEELTNENLVIDYIKENHRLPDYYITKSEARSEGWNPGKGNLCDVLPGKAIGGDHFSNRERTLPKGNQYFEADVNYSCGNRNADRLVFTKEGEVWLTKNHYKSFEKQ